MEERFELPEFQEFSVTYGASVIVPAENAVQITFKSPPLWYYLVPGKVKKYYKEIEDFMAELETSLNEPKET